MGRLTRVHNRGFDMSGAAERLTREARTGTACDYSNEYGYDAAGNRTKWAYAKAGALR